MSTSGGSENGGGLNSLLNEVPPVPSSSPFDVNKNFAIQQIKNKLMSDDFETTNSNNNNNLAFSGVVSVSQIISL